MKPRLLLVAFAAVLLVSPAAQTAPVPTDTKNAASPAIVVQVQPIEQLIDTVKATAKNFLGHADLR